MSKQVDSRIVQMQFDNKKFEEGVKTTLNSINKLDSTLNALNDISLKGFEKLGDFTKNFDLSGIGRAAEAVTDRMSAMGIVGARVLSNLTDAAMNTAKHLADITIGQVMTGGKNRALNLESAKFQLEGLGVSWESIKDNINAGVKDTAYGLDAAAKVASQLVASNVKVGEEMEHSLVAVSGVAAMTNSTYEDIGHIFTSVAGNGRLMGDQLQQLSGRGLNAAAALAKQLGKTEAEIREMTSKGQIDFMTFSQAMYEAFGSHAKEANKTFTGSLSNMKAALSRIGAEFYTPGLEYARDVFNAITPAIDALKGSLKEYNVFDNASRIMKTLSENVVKFFESLGDTKAVNSFLKGPLKLLSGALGSISTLLNRGVHTEIFKSIINGLSSVWKMVRAVASGFKAVFPIDLVKTITKFADHLKESRKEFDANASIYTRVRDVAKGIAAALDVVFKVSKAVIGVTKPFFDSALERLNKILTFFSDIGKKIYKFDQDVNSVDLFVKWSNKIDDIKLKFLELKIKVEDSLDLINAKFKEKFGKTIPELIQKLKDKVTELFSGKDKKEEKQGIDFFGILEVLINGVTKAVLLLIDVFGAFYKVFGGQIGIFTSIQEAFSKMSEGADNFVGKLNAIIQFMKGDQNLASYGLKSSEGFEKFLTGLRDGFTKLKTGAKGAFEYFKGIFGNLKNVFMEAGGYIFEAFKKVGDRLRTISFSDILKAGGLSAGILLLKDFFEKIKEFTTKQSPIEKLVDSLSGLGSSVGGFFDQLKKALGGGEEETSKVDELKNLAVSVAILTGALLILSSIDAESLGRSMSIVTMSIAELLGSLYLFNKHIKNDEENENIAALADMMVKLSASVLILAFALKMISSIDTDKLVSSFMAVAGLLAELGFSMYLISTYVKNAPKVGGTLLAMAVAIRLLVGAMKGLAKLETGQLVKGLVGIAALLGEVIGFTLAFKKLKLAKTLNKIVGPLVLFAVALNMLVVPLAALALIGAAGQLGPTLVAFGILLGEIALFSAIMTDVEVGDFTKLAASLVIFAVALNMMLIPLAALAVIGASGQLGVTLLAFGVLLGEIALFSAIMSEAQVGEFLKLSAALIVFAVALNLMIAPLVALSLIDVTQALIGLGLLMLELGVFTYAMQSIGGGGSLAALSAGLIIFAIAMNMLIPPLAALASMQNLGKALLGFAAIVAILAVMVGFAAALSGFAGAILAVSAAFLLIGAAIALVGVGIAGLGAGIYLIVAAFRLLIQTVSEFADSFVDLAIKAANGIIAFLLTLANAEPELIEGLGKIIITFCNAMLKAVPKIVETIGEILFGILDYLSKRVPDIIDRLLKLVFGILHGLLNGLMEKVPVLARDLYNLCMTILDETVKLLKQTPMDLVDIFFGGGFNKDKNSGKKISEFFKGLFDKNKDSKEVQEAGEQTGEQVVDSVSETIDSQESKNKVDDSLNSLLDGSANSILNNDSMPNAMTSLSEKSLDGFEDPLNIVGGESLEMKNIAGYTQDGFLNNMDPSKFYDAGSLNMSEYIKGMKDEGGIASPSKEAMKIAGFLDEGFGIGMERSTFAEQASEEKVQSVLTAFESAGNMMRNFKMPSLTAALQSIFDSQSLLDDTYEPTIAPVLDTSNLSRGFTSLDSMLSSQRSLALAGEAAYLQESGRNLSMEIQNGNSKDMNQNFNTLGTKLDKLGDAILNSQIVLDSGELVGGIASPMDRTLGIRAIRAQRGGRRS